MAKKPSDMLDMDALRRDPVAFARLLQGPNGEHYEPHAKQMEIMRGLAPVTTCVTGRQVGKTTCMAWIAEWFAVTKANKKVMIVAPALEQARIMMDEIVWQFEQAPLKYFVKGKIKQYPFPEIELKNGSTITARGANSPQFIRGNRVHLCIVDEAAFVKDEVITKVIQPMFTVTGKEPGSALILISTPFGDGTFKDWYLLGLPDTPGHTPRYASHHATSLENPHADMEFLLSIREQYGEDSPLWMTEYLGLFDADDVAVVPWADIKWAVDNYGDTFPQPAVAGHRYVQGVDLANRRDYFVSTILDTTNQDALRLVKMARYQQRGYTFYKEEVRRLYQQYNHASTLLDATTLAESVVEDLADIHAEGFAFTGNAAKHEIVQELVRAFAEHRVLIPNNRDIINELRYFQYKISPNKVLRMEAKAGFHDDIFMALALANHQARKPRGFGGMRALTWNPALPPITQAAGYYDPWADAFLEDD